MYSSQQSHRAPVLRARSAWMSPLATPGRAAAASLLGFLMPPAGFAAAAAPRCPPLPPATMASTESRVLGTGLLPAERATMKRLSFFAASSGLSDSSAAVAYARDEQRRSRFTQGRVRLRRCFLNLWRSFMSRAATSVVGSV